MKRVLITGANSYIGVSVEKWLNQWKDEYEVDTLDMQKEDWKEHDFSKYDSVFHVAGIAHADTRKVKEEEKQLYYKVNSELAIETAKKSKKQGVKQFILMSSMIIYGGVEHITKDTQPNPTNFYGDSKWQADKGVRNLADTKFHVVVIRPPMIYGKGSKGNYPTLAKIAKKLPIFPKVNNQRSILYIENLCEFVKQAINTQAQGIFFPQNEELVNTSQLVELIAETTGHKIKVTKVLTPFVILGKYMPGAIGNVCKKAFGSSYYDLEMSSDSAAYNIADLELSIRKTEG